MQSDRWSSASPPYPWLGSDGAPLQTSRYRRKLRLLAANDCSGTCWFCHNEGMPKLQPADLDIAALRHVLPTFGPLVAYRAVISGGEPAMAANAKELIDALADEAYDVTLIASQVGIDRLPTLLDRVGGLHFSVRLHDYQNRGSDPSLLWARLMRMRRSNRGLRLVFNTTVENARAAAENLDAVLAGADSLHAGIKLLGLFEGTTPARRRQPDVWIERWNLITQHLAARAFEFFSFDGRTAKFEHADGRSVELSEISCLSSGQQYGEGQCFGNMDFVIDPWSRLRLCRWQQNGVPIASLGATSSIVGALDGLTRADAAGCVFGTGLPPMMRSHDSTVRAHTYAPHTTWPAVEREMLEPAHRLIDTLQLSYFGREGIVAELETAFARAAGAEDALAVSSGTAALFLAYLALDFTAETEVIVPVYSYPGTVTPLLTTGARIVFCDVEADTGNIDVDSFRRVITPRTKGVVITHLWGHPANVDAIADECIALGIRIVEDCSHALGAAVHGAPIGSRADAACFSLQANKMVFAGEGGMLLMRDRERFERAISLASLGDRMRHSVTSAAFRPFRATGLGLKLKMHPIGAALALGSLRALDQHLDARELRMTLLDEYVRAQPGVEGMPRKSYATRRAYYTYKLLLREQLATQRYEITAALCRGGLEAKLPDWGPLVETPAFTDNTQVVAPLGSYPGASRFFARIISLPTFTTEDVALVRYYGETIQRVLGDACSASARVPAGDVAMSALT